MPPINTADIELWWSHPNYTPPLARVRHKSAAITEASPGDIFRMDSSFPTIDDLTLGSLAGRLLGVKEHMGIGQVTKRRSFVNTEDVKEATGGFTVNVGDPGGPDEYFTAVIGDPGLNRNGRKRPGTVIGVLAKTLGATFADTAGPSITAAVDLSSDYAAGATEMNIDTVAGAPIVPGMFFRLAGNDQIYEVTSGSVAVDGEGVIRFTRINGIVGGLAAQAADDTALTFLTRTLVPNLDRYTTANKWDFVLSELDFPPEVEGELMGSFTIQAAGTGFEYVRQGA